MSKPTVNAGRTLGDWHSGRVLQSVEERTAEWVSYCTDLLSGSTPISTEVLAQLPAPPPPPSDSPYPEPTLDEVVTAIKCLKINKSPGVCNIPARNAQIWWGRCSSGDAPAEFWAFGAQRLHLRTAGRTA
ncbi:hypothetical protein ABBQ38_014581 [Trebouxia sp. C0009 RCD-2024]